MRLKSNSRDLSLSTIVILFLFLVFTACQSNQYPKFGESRIVLQGDMDSWDEKNVHTMSVVEADRDGFRYWAYYGLNHYGDPAEVKKAGLARSNDLIHWEKYSDNPVILSNCRWPNAIYRGGVFHLFYAEYLPSMDSRIVHVTSENGYSFSEKDVIVTYEDGFQNQNPFIYYNEQDNKYYLFYYHGRERGENTGWCIYVKKAGSIDKLAQAHPKEIMSESFIIAAPSITYYDGYYYLLIEALKDGEWSDKWVTLAYKSSYIDKEFIALDNNPVLFDDDACAFQYVLGRQLYIFYSHRLNMEDNTWDLRMVRSEK